MNQVIVLGCNGMLGHVFYLNLEAAPDFEVVGVGRSNKWFPNIECYDFHDPNFWHWIEQQEPVAVVNCAGILVRDSDQRPAEAIYINSYLPHRLAEIFADRSTVLVQISTDCVFSGKHGPYGVNSPHDGEGYYARTKSLGEVPKAVTIRTSIVGPELKSEGTGLFHWWTQQAGEIKGFKQAWWSGLTTMELTRCISDFLSYCSGTKDVDPPVLPGLCQLAAMSISKFNLLSDWNRVFRRNQTVLPDESYVCNKVLLPSYGVPLAIPDPLHLSMANRMKLWIEEHPDLYPHYQHLIKS